MNKFQKCPGPGFLEPRADTNSNPDFSKQISFPFEIPLKFVPHFIQQVMAEKKDSVSGKELWL